MAQDPKKPKKKRNTEYPVLLLAARTPLPPREQCAVFGCRRADTEPAALRPLPEEPHRWSEWLSLINRQDLSDKLRSGTCTARVCSAHFAPDSPHTPTLLLPKRTHVVYADPGPSELAEEVDIKPVVKTEDDYEDTTVEIEFEPEQPPTYCFYETGKPTERIAIQEGPERYSLHIPDPALANQESSIQKTKTQEKPERRTIQRQKTKMCRPTLEIDCGVLKTYTPRFSIQNQTDSVEALYKQATFSVVENIDIPPMLIHKYDDIISRSVSVQTPSEFIEYFSAAVKRPLTEQLETMKRTLISLENMPMEKNKFVKNCDKYLNEKIVSFVKSHAYLTDKFPDGKYPLQFRYFTLNLYLLNPQSYKFVEQFFDLPGKGKIERFHMPLKSGINIELLTSLKVKTDQMTAVGRMCAVSFDVMRLTKRLYYDVTNDYLCGVQEIDQVIGAEPAGYAAIIMVRGLYNRWKQPISFALISEKKQHPELKAWVLKVISTLFSIGLHVKAFVNNLDDEFLDFSIDDGYFEVDGKTVYQFYDVPYLFKCARDALMQYDFYIENSVAKWEDVINVYSLDIQQEYRLMPNITEEHVSPSPSSREDVKLATQVFCNSIAAAMHFNVVAKLLPKRTKDTVQFLTRMGTLYDILSSRTLAKAYRGTLAQNRFLKETLEWLRSLEVRDVYGNVIECKFTYGLIVTIKSLMNIQAHLKKCNVHYLLTKNLSQDCIRSHFKDVQRLGKSEQPTPIKFVRALRRLYLVNLLKNTKKGASEDDIMKTLVKIGEFVKEDLEKRGDECRNSLAVGVNDYKINWPSKEYLAGYLLWKCLEKHACKTLIHNLSEYYHFDESDADLLHIFQCYNGHNLKKNLTKPPKNLVQFVDYMETKCDEFMTQNFIQNANFARCILTTMDGVTFDMPCPCFPIKYLKMLFVRLKIYSSVKLYNKKLKEADQTVQLMDYSHDIVCL